MSDVGNANTQVYVAKCDANANFNITGVPPGTYTLTMWDFPLDNVIDSRTIVIPPTGGAISMGQIPVFRWFGFYDGSIFNDVNQNGVRDPGEAGIPNLLVDYRFRDGSIYQATVTDASGEFVFSEVFPFFKWIVAESDYSRFKPTGATVYVDKGGPLVNGTIPLLETRTDTGPFPFLLEGMILYNGSNAKIDWGRVPYAPGENGGIVGVVYYAVTRAQADPSLAAAETWEPGIPDVTINLYKVTGYDNDGKPITQGPINTYLTDSWDKNLPTGCKAAMQAAGLPSIRRGSRWTIHRLCRDHPVLEPDQTCCFRRRLRLHHRCPGQPASCRRLCCGGDPPGGICAREGRRPERDRGRGRVYSVCAAACASAGSFRVGADHVPFLLRGPTVSRQPDRCCQPGLSFRGSNKAALRPKLVRLSDGQNAATDFHLWTHVAPAGRIIGLVTDDLTPEFRRGNPRLDMIGVPFMPISFQDRPATNGPYVYR